MERETAKSSIGDSLHTFVSHSLEKAVQMPVNFVASALSSAYSKEPLMSTFTTKDNDSVAAKLGDVMGGLLLVGEGAAIFKGVASAASIGKAFKAAPVQYDAASRLSAMPGVGGEYMKFQYSGSGNALKRVDVSASTMGYGEHTRYLAPAEGASYWTRQDKFGHRFSPFGWSKPEPISGGFRVERGQAIFADGRGLQERFIPSQLEKINVGGPASYWQSASVWERDALSHKVSDAAGAAATQRFRKHLGG